MWSAVAVAVGRRRASGNDWLSLIAMCCTAKRLLTFGGPNADAPLDMMARIVKVENLMALVSECQRPKLGDL